MKSDIWHRASEGEVHRAQGWEGGWSKIVFEFWRGGNYACAEMRDTSEPDKSNHVVAVHPEHEIPKLRLKKANLEYLFLTKGTRFVT
jgi:hypothetical protein